jgi:hypothetical protein
VASHIPQDAEISDKHGINAGCIEGIDMFALRPILIEGSKV